MAVAVRVVACLDVHDGKVTKGVKFQGNVDVGDPLQLARKYDTELIDELVFYDITASAESRRSVVDLIQDTSDQIFIPFTVGGGVSEVEDFDRLLRAGADKISVNSGAIRDLRELAAALRDECALRGVVLVAGQAEDPRRGADRRGRAARRAGRQPHRAMSDIVETIQAEQDRVIRSSHLGVLVVEGGPGTGKTAVALHRAAFLLYTYRRELSKRGVLIVGPNATFLRYISQVLPSLGETGVLLSTLGDLYPGVSARRAEPAEEAQVKGRLVMADVVAAAVRDRQWVPDDGLEIAVGRDRLWLDRRVCERAAELARHSRLPHNPARPIVVREIIDALARQLADRIGADVRGGKNLLDETDLEEIRRDLRGEPAGTAGAGPAVADPDAGAPAGRPLRQRGAARPRRGAAAARRTGPAAARPGRRLDPRGRAVAGRGGRAARRGRSGGARPGGTRAPDADRRGQGRAGHPHRFSRARAGRPG